MNEEIKKMTEEQEKKHYTQMYKEILPHLEMIRQKMVEHGESKTLHISVGADGYLSMGVTGSGWEALRFSSDEDHKATIKKEIRETVEF